MGPLLALMGIAALFRITSADVCRADAFGVVTCLCQQQHPELSFDPIGNNRIISSATRFEVFNCSRVLIASKTIARLAELKSIRFANIERLELEDSSFEWQTSASWGLEILIENCSLPILPSYLIKGRIEDIFLRSVYIEVIRPFTVSSISETNRIEIKDSTVGQIDTSVFKKFSMNSIAIVNNTFNTIPSRTLSDINVDSFVFSNNRVREMKSSSFIINNVRRVLFENNVIGIMEGETLKVLGTGDVHIMNNTINDFRPGALLGLSVRGDTIRRYGLQDLYFQNNTISLFKQQSFSYHPESYKILAKHVSVERICDCSLWDEFQVINQALACKNEANQFYPLVAYTDHYCGRKGISAGILGVSIFSAILILCIVLLILLLIYRRHRRNQDIVDEKVIKPDGKTYKETELYVVVEKTDLLTTDL